MYRFVPPNVQVLKEKNAAMTMQAASADATRNITFGDIVVQNAEPLQNMSINGTIPWDDQEALNELFSQWF